MPENMPTTQEAPVDHLLRGVLPPEAVAALEAQTPDVVSPASPPPFDSPPVPERPPVDTPVPLKEWEVLPACCALPCRDFGKNSDGLTILHGIIQHVAVDRLGVTFSLNLVALFMGGQGVFQVDTAIEADGCPVLHLPAVDVEFKPNEKGFLYQQIVEWPLLVHGPHRFVVRVAGHKVAEYVVPVIPRSVK